MSPKQVTESLKKAKSIRGKPQTLDAIASITGLPILTIHKIAHRAIAHARAEFREMQDRERRGRLQLCRAVVAWGEANAEILEHEGEPVLAAEFRVYANSAQATLRRMV